MEHLRNSTLFQAMKTDNLKCLIINYIPMKKYLKIQISFEINTEYWALIPNVNLNFNNGFCLEIEWLCLGIYIH